MPSTNKYKCLILTKTALFPVTLTYLMSKKNSSQYVYMS